MRGFIDNVFPYRERFRSIKIQRTEEVRIQQLVLRLLKLKDLNKLRDRFEGVRFYERLRKDIKGLIAVERILGVRLMNWDMGRAGDLELPFDIGGKTFHVKTIEYGQWPIVLPSGFENIILNITKGTDTIWVVGTASRESIKNSIRPAVAQSPLAHAIGVELLSITCFVGFPASNEVVLN